MAKEQPFKDLRGRDPRIGELICLFPITIQTKGFENDSFTRKNENADYFQPFLARFDNLDPECGGKGLSILDYALLPRRKVVKCKFLGMEVEVPEMVEAGYEWLINGRTCWPSEKGGPIRYRGRLRLSPSKHDLKYYRFDFDKAHRSFEDKIEEDHCDLPGYEGWYVGKDSILKRFSKEEGFGWWCEHIAKLENIATITLK